ncbi:hypothetical protein AZE42_06087 [Rhizopogon vesiculosus]|uniref:Uncharacterized protein n=1 Tax=Rhizopogon vesiculosus TaxID=180088 RepID=A0A1J8PJJ6_9AGAM|nr:hypothetical protein AZE42_06087 [Rhizopogon vesiculosus]
MFLSDKRHTFVFPHSSEFVRPDYVYRQADYVASEEDGIRPYSFFFCLSWFQKKEKKPDPPPQVYDIDLMKAEQEEDPLDIPIPTAGVQFAQQEGIELTRMSRQPQPEAGESRHPENEECLSS